MKQIHDTASPVLRFVIGCAQVGTGQVLRLHQIEPRFANRDADILLFRGYRVLLEGLGEGPSLIFIDALPNIDNFHWFIQYFSIPIVQPVTLAVENGGTFEDSVQVID